MGTIADSKLYLCTFLSKGGDVQKDYLTKTEFCGLMNLPQDDAEVGKVYLSRHHFPLENFAGVMNEASAPEKESYDDVDDFAAEAERRYFDGMATQAERFSHD